MRSIVSTLLVASLGLIPLCANTTDKSIQKGMAELAKVATFLEKNMMGRTLIREHHDTIAQGTIYTDFVAKSTFHGLERTQSGLRYTKSHVISQTLWDLDKKGKKIGKGRTKDRVLTSRYEVKVSRATQALMGYHYGVTNTIVDPTGYASIIRSMKVADDKLELWIDGTNYSSCFGKNDTYTPCTSSSKTSYSIENDKLVKTSTTTMYDVDPKTFERTKYKKDAVTSKTVREK